MEIRDVQTGRGALCERVLRALPEWFGIEEAIRQYAVDVESMMVLAAHVRGELAGFLALHRHNHATSEIHVMGLLKEFHRQGIGRALVEDAARRAKAGGGRLLSVKTLSASRPCPEYDGTRRFYEALGFLPVEEFKTLWGPANPCLLLVRQL